MRVRAKLTDADYQALLDFRNGLRRYLHWSSEEAAKAGLTTAQHQLLLAVRGHPGPDKPTITDVAHDLMLRHHSAVELADRAEKAGLIERLAEPSDRRVTRLGLTPQGKRKLENLAGSHLEELARMAPRIARLWSGLKE